MRTYAEIAAEVLRERILSGELAAGARLNEVALSTALQISRQPLREALRTLHGEGLVELTRGRGATVARFDLDALHQLGDIRLALETATARLAAQRADRDDLTRLTTVIAEIEDALRDPARPYPRHTDFHGVLAAATKNPRLTHAVDEVKQQLRLARARSGNDPGRARQALLEHRAVCDAVVRADPDAAEQAMRLHIEASLKAMLALVTDSDTVREQP
jgi:DNA-binding GntR family transcriptional regulator